MSRHRPVATAIVVSGPPGSGKTTLATALARHLGYAIVDLDTVSGALTRAALRLLGAAEDAVDGPEGQGLRAARYDALLDVAAANLAAGLGVIVAAPFSREWSQPGGWAAVAGRLSPAGEDGAMAFIYVNSPPELRRARLAGRAAPRDLRKLHSVAALAGPDPSAPPGSIVIDGARPLPEKVTAALAALGVPVAGPAAAPAAGRERPRTQPAPC